MGSGFSTKLNLKFNLYEKLQIQLNTEDYRIYSWVDMDRMILRNLTQVFMAMWGIQV